MPSHPKVTRLPVVGVMGSGSDAHAELASAVGTVLANEGVHLLTGGGGGTMEEVSKAFVKARGQGQGRVIGVIPGDSDSGSLQEGYPNPWVEIPIYTHLPLSGITGTSSMSRNHINIRTCDALVFLPGGDGTFSEFSLATRYQKPRAGFFAEGLIPNYWEGEDPWFDNPWDLTCWVRNKLR